MNLMNLPFIYFLCYFITDIVGLRVTEISIPKYIDRREKASLSCKFELNGDKLYSVKWYKDEFEFFRYMPDSNPKIKTFSAQGVYLDISRSNMTTVTLHRLNFNTSGNYRCEVSTDAPNFETYVANDYMTVVDTVGLRVTEISIPRYIDRREKASLSCKFELTGGKLYSVKWYKDEFEFFRYMPDDIPKIQTFPVQGVYLDLSQSNITTVTLHQLNFNTSGNYRCEVSTDGPNFETFVRNDNMTVVAYPEGDPTIQGLRSSYSIGDFVSGNCTSSRSNPVANLSWFINNRKADQDILLNYPVVLGEELLYSKALGIHFRIENDHFENNILELTCTAKVADSPDRTIVHKIHPQSFNRDMIQAQNRLNKGLALTNHFHITISMLLSSCFNFLSM